MIKFKLIFITILICITPISVIGQNHRKDVLSRIDNFFKNHGGKNNINWKQIDEGDSDFNIYCDSIETNLTNELDWVKIISFDLEKNTLFLTVYKYRRRNFAEKAKNEFDVLLNNKKLAFCINKSLFYTRTILYKKYIISIHNYKEGMNEKEFSNICLNVISFLYREK